QTAPHLQASPVCEWSMTAPASPAVPPALVQAPATGAASPYWGVMALIWHFTKPTADHLLGLSRQAASPVGITLPCPTTKAPAAPAAASTTTAVAAPAGPLFSRAM